LIVWKNNLSRSIDVEVVLNLCISKLALIAPTPREQHKGFSVWCTRIFDCKTIILTACNKANAAQPYQGWGVLHFDCKEVLRDLFIALFFLKILHFIIQIFRAKAQLAEFI